MDDGQRKRDSASGLKAFRPRELTGVLSFVVTPRESDPHQAGPIEVVMDRDGLKVWFDGAAESEAWDVTWTELRQIAENKRLLLIEDASLLADMQQAREAAEIEKEAERRGNLKELRQKAGILSIRTIRPEGTTAC